MQQFKETGLYKELLKKDSQFITSVDEVYRYAEDMLPKINTVFSNYTDHGIRHSVRIMEHSVALISDISLLSELEIVIIIYTALLHDIGMVVDDYEIDNLKREDEKNYGIKYSVVLNKYKDEKIALQECFRPIHGLRSQKRIEEIEKQNLFNIPGTEGISFVEEVAKICASHNESYEWINENIKKQAIKGEFNFNAQFIAILLRLGDILDIDEQRTPSYLYNLFDLNDYSNLEWKQHFVIDNTKKVFISEKASQKHIAFHGSSDDPEVHRKILKYIEHVNAELEKSVKTCEEFGSEKYLLNLRSYVINNIETRGFSFSDFKLSLDYKAVTGLLMGEKIYGDKKYGVRELIQNSIDACKLMKEIKAHSSMQTGEEYSPVINIIIDKGAGKVTVKDNGVGMTLDILKKYFLNVGISYYSSDDFIYKGYKYNPIGKFGIGFLACFMLSDNVIVKAKHYTQNVINEVEIERASEYICLSCTESIKTQGTEVVLNYNSFVNVFANKIDRVKSFIEENFLIDDVNIRFIIVENGEHQKIICSSKPNIKSSRNSLKDYLHGIDANVVIKDNYKYIDRLKELTDGSSNEVYIYDERDNSLSQDEEVNINDFICDDRVMFLKIPIIDDSLAEKFNKLIEALEDWDEAYEKIEGEIDAVIYIFAKKFDELTYADGVVEGNEEIIGYYRFEEFCDKFSSDKDCGTKVEVVKREVSHRADIRSVLPIKANESIGYDYRSLYPLSFVEDNRKTVSRKIYNKNVFLSKMVVVVPHIVDVIKIDSVIINLLDKEIVPNLARDNIDDQSTCKEIGYALGKAIHLHLLETGGLNEQQKILLRIFIDKYYSTDNRFLKKNTQKEDKQECKN